MMMYRDLVNSFCANPREIPTAPINGGTPKWFYVYERQGTIYISSGREHSNVCHVNPDRRLKPSEFSTMLDIYQRRKQGEPVSQEAKKQSINQSYWFGIFKATEEQL